MIKLMAPDALGKDAQDRLKNLGINTAELSDKNKSLAERLQVLKPLLTDSGALVKVFGAENALGAQILISQTEELKKFTAGLDANGTTQEQADIKSKTLTEAWGRLKAQGEALFLSIRSGANGLSATLDFLSNNFDSIVTAVKYLIEAFVSYKAVQTALNLKQNYSDWQANRKAIKETGEALKEGSDGAKGFGNALKGIGLSIAITVLFEVGKALYDIASGARKAREDLALLEKQVDISTKRADKNVGTIQKDLDTKVKEYNLRLKKQGITGIEFQKLSADFAKKEAENAKSQISNLKKVSYQKVLNYKDDLRILEIGLKNNVFLARNMNDITVTAKKVLNPQEIQRLIELNVKFGNTTDAISNTKGAIGGVTKAFQTYGSQLENVNSELIDLESNVVDTQNTIKGSDKTTEKKVKNEKKVVEAKKERVLTEEEIYQMELAQLAKIEDEKTKTAGEAEKERLQNEADTLEEVSTMRIKIWEKQIADEEEARKKAEEAEKERLKNRYENVKKYTELANNLAQSQLDKRIELIDKEIDASKKKESELEDLAKNGNIKANESIAEQERIQNEQLAQKQKAERQKQLIQSTTAFLTAYTNELENGKSSGEALTIALTDKALLDGIISALPTFFVGTEDTGNGGNLDNNGGFLSVLHPNERVMTKEQNQQLNGMSNDEVVKMVQKAKINNVQNGSFENVGVLSELNGLKSELGAIKQAILNRPETNIELGAITQGAMEIVHSTKKGNKTTVNTFKVRN
jgi:hypothetical protein